MQRFFTVLTLCTLTTLNVATAQEYSPNRWKETTRLNPFDQEADYTDTVWLNTFDRHTIDIVIGGYAYQGTVAGDSLDIKKRTFEVVKNDPEEIRLKFKKLTHIFTRELKGAAGADAEAFAAQNKIPDVPVKKINQKQLYGTWLVYKKPLRKERTSDVHKMQYLKKLEIFRKAQKGAKGRLTNASNLVMPVKGWKGKELKYRTTLQQTRSLSVLKQSPAELLLEDENKVVYFLKKY